MTKAKKKNPMAKKIKVLLLKPLPPKGNAGDIIDVKTHYALHVLIPQGIAVVYDKQTQNQHEFHKKRIKKNKSELQERIITMIDSIKENGGIIIEKFATEKGKLYDSITQKTIAQYITETYNVKVGSDAIKMENKIESLGEYEIQFQYESIEETIPLHIKHKQKQ